MTAVAVTLPSAKEEAWKYTPVEKIVGSLLAASPAEAAQVPLSTVDELAGGHGGTRLVFVNGIHAPRLSDDSVPTGVKVDLAAVNRRSDDDVDGFELLNRSAASDTASITVDPGVTVESPIHVVHLAVPGEALAVAHPRTHVVVGAGAGVAVIETYCGLPGPVLTNASTTILAGPSSTVDHVRVQSEASEAIHVGRTVVQQAEASTMRHTSVMVGADIARHEIDVRLGGADARTELAGLYLPTGHQRHDNVVTVEHAASGGVSTQLFKGVIDDHGRGSFSGRVVVLPATAGNDASQTNRNLLLSRTAEADSRPWLEILADDVRCTHGATVGRLDEDALFYLRSRGIPLFTGREMLIDAFIRDITDGVVHPLLRAHLANVAVRR